MHVNAFTFNAQQVRLSEVAICMGEDKNEDSEKMVALTALFLILF